MKERPIIFSSEMVLALLDGRKTMTRRVVKLDGIERVSNREEFLSSSPYPLSKEDGGGTAYFKWNGKTVGLRCPYGKVGDRLWVRENWNYIGQSIDFGKPNVKDIFIRYCADDPSGIKTITINRDINIGLPKPLNRKPYEPEFEYEKMAYDNHFEETFKVRSSLFMPRWASRITIEITDIRVERLQDISEMDCYREGIYGPNWAINKSNKLILAQGAFADLWESIKGEGSWDLNPWVWVIEFKRL